MKSLNYALASIILITSPAFSYAAILPLKSPLLSPVSKSVNHLVNLERNPSDGQMSPLAQRQVNYGTHLRHGLELENQRHSRVLSQIQQARNTANAEFKIQVNHCANGNSQAYKQCVQEANAAYRNRLTAINDLQIQENALYANNKLKIQQYWQGQYRYDCNRPDCINNVRGKDSGCSSGNCH